MTGSEELVLGPWFRCDANMLSDERVVELGEKHGPAGPLAWHYVLAQAKLAGRRGLVQIAVRQLAAACFCSVDDARLVVASIRESSLVDAIEGASMQVRNWERYQPDPRPNARTRKLQAAPDTDSEPPGSATTPQLVPDGPRDTPVSPRTTRQDSTREDQDQPHVAPQAARRAPRSKTTDVEIAFAAWQDSTGRTGTRLDERRRRLIRKALDGYPLADVLAAVEGWKHSPHHRGENDAGTVYNELGLLLRNGEHIERFRDLAKKPRHRPPPSSARPEHREFVATPIDPDARRRGLEELRKIQHRQEHNEPRGDLRLVEAGA